MGLRPQDTYLDYLPPHPTSITVHSPSPISVSSPASHYLVRWEHLSGKIPEINLRTFGNLRNSSPPVLNHVQFLSETDDVTPVCHPPPRGPLDEHPLVSFGRPSSVTFATPHFLPV